MIMKKKFLTEAQLNDKPFLNYFKIENCYI